MSDKYIKVAQGLRGGVVITCHTKVGAPTPLFNRDGGYLPCLISGRKQFNSFREAIGVVKGKYVVRLRPYSPQGRTDRNFSLKNEILRFDLLGEK